MGSQRIPFISAMAMTQHGDGDDDGSYLELLDVLTDHGARPADDRAELFRRIAFTILISNTDDHLRIHGFLWQGKHGWALSPYYDLNPVADAPRVLKTRIDYDDATASLRLLREVSEFFCKPDLCTHIIRQCPAVTRSWRDFATARQAP